MDIEDLDKQEKQLAKKEKRTLLKDVLTTIGLVLIVAVTIFLIFAYIFRSYQVDGPSMESTLHNSDKLIIWKVPKTWSDITGHPYVPNRGDIIVFTESGLSEFGQEDTKQLIKRVIGLPGDAVIVKDGHYLVINSKNPNGFDPDKTLPYGKNGKNMPITSGDGTYKLASDQLFVSGDNRPNSLDSRDFGPINTNQVVGKLMIRVWPLNQPVVF